MSNKSILFLLILAILSSIALGCSFNNEAEIAKLRTQATQEIQVGNFDQAISNYEQILTLSSEEVYKKELEDIQYELDSAKKVKEIKESLYGIEREKLRSGISVSATDFEYILKDLKHILDDLESIDVNRNTEIATYLKNKKESLEYANMKSATENEFLTKDSGTTDMLSELDTEFGIQMGLTRSVFRDQVLDGIKLFTENELPEKYRNIR